MLGRVPDVDMAGMKGEKRRWLVVVRRDKSDLYLKLRHSFEPDPQVTVIFDRRLGDRRVDAQATLRIQEEHGRADGADRVGVRGVELGF